MAKIAGMQEVSLSLLKPYERNAKTHGEDQIELLMRSISEFGFLSPCLVERDSYAIIAGHGRVEAAKRLGMTEVPCVFVEDLTEEQRRAYILADNRLTELGAWDESTLSHELAYLNDMNFDIEVTGFDLGDINVDVTFAPDDVRSTEAGQDERGYSITYEIVFTNEAEQDEWYGYLKLARQSFPDDDTIGQKILHALKEWADGKEEEVY